MDSSGFIHRALATLKARPWSLLGGLLVAVVGVAAVYSLTVEPTLAPPTAAASRNPPYRSDIDARTAIEAGKARAAASGKMLMVTFGANWCPDCLTLYGNLRSAETRAYAEEHFEMVSIDVGDTQKNAAVQRDLGISVNVIRSPAFMPRLSLICLGIVV